MSESLDLYKYKVGDCLAHDLAQHQQQRTADLPKDYFFTKSILNKRWLDGLSINEEKRQQFQGVPAFLSGDRQFDFYNATDYDFSAKAVQVSEECSR